MWSSGYSWGFSKADYLTIKYAAADGALLWEKRYNSPANGYDEARAVAVDGIGDVVVTGRSFDVDFTKSDYYTAKYAAGDGALLWEKRYNCPTDGQDQATAVAVDGTGNVVVTGNTFLMDYRESDYYTAKYASADGALLWEKRFKGPGGVGDSPHCLALGPGTVAVTGTSNGGYGTVVYRDVPALSIDLIPTGIRLRFSGLPARVYNIERAHAVIGPWSTLNVQTAPASGTFEYVDINLPAAATFYRASEP